MKIEIDYQCNCCGLYLDEGEHTMFGGLCEQCSEESDKPS